jgi:hypothetical protein
LLETLLVGITPSRKRKLTELSIPVKHNHSSLLGVVRYGSFSVCKLLLGGFAALIASFGLHILN